LLIDKEFKAGYVNLPGFYINSESNDWRGTSLDMGKALYKLLQDNVEGLLIDLRQNGGGSMKEAVDLANLFIDGPVTILKQKDNIITVYNDEAASLFNKPIVIIVDSYSASAAELFAGVMQDYGKAVIVGDVTFGKATSQNIYPLNPDEEQLGFLKITSELFYRVTGKSHQKSGLIPDIQIANLFTGLAEREVDYPYVLEAEALDVSESISSNSLPIEKLKLSSLNRQNESEVFKNIKAVNTNLTDYIYNRKTAYPFLPESVFEDYNSYKKLWDDVLDYFQEKEYLAFKLTTYDSTKDDKTNKQRLENFKKYAASDPVILESYQILKELHSLIK
jgi:carboxyl-terminal processing protease